MLAQTEQTSPISIRLWTWPELVRALKECQESLPSSNTSFITQRVLDCLVEKLVLPSPSSQQCTFQLPSTARKSGSSSNKYSPTAWWFEDLAFLSVDFLEKLLKTMISRGLNHRVVSKFLFYYRKSKCHCAELVEKRGISEAVIGLLTLLDGRSISFKGLFNVYQAASRVKVRKKYRHVLESLIGSQLDQVPLDYLLVPSPRGRDFIYDVDMVLKLVKSFLLIADRCRLPLTRLNKVGRLMDSYISEVASDPKMKHSKFLELVVALPDCARESHDGLYRAMDLYFEVQRKLCEDEKMSLCCAMNYEKLSIESLKHLARNSKFPSRISVKAFMSQSSKLTSLIRDIYHLKSFSEGSWYCDTPKEMVNRSKEDNDDEKFEADLKELVDWNEKELRKVCRTTQPVDYTRTSGRYLPKLCGC